MFKMSFLAKEATCLFLWFVVVPIYISLSALSGKQQQVLPFTCRQMFDGSYIDSSDRSCLNFYAIAIKKP